MTVHSMAPILADNSVFFDIAERAKISHEALRSVLADLDELEVRQIGRLCKAAKARRLETTNRATRRGR